MWSFVFLPSPFASATQDTYLSRGWYFPLGLSTWSHRLPLRSRQALYCLNRSRQALYCLNISRNMALCECQVQGLIPLLQVIETSQVTLQASWIIFPQGSGSHLWEVGAGSGRSAFKGKTSCRARRAGVCVLIFSDSRSQETCSGLKCCLRGGLYPLSKLYTSMGENKGNKRKAYFFMWTLISPGSWLVGFTACQTHTV